MRLNGAWRRPVFGLAAAMAMLLVAQVSSAADMPIGERIEQCAGCHGPDGNSRMEKIPSLAGQPEFFVLNQLFLMREGVRRVEAMMPYVKDLTDAAIDALAKYFSGLEPKPSGGPIDPALVARGAALAGPMRCGSCHLPNLAGQQQMPRLAGQRVDYMIDALKAYRDNSRSGADTSMTAVVVGVSDADLTALAHYAASR
jgi:cytochrome c553